MFERLPVLGGFEAIRVEARASPALSESTLEKPERIAIIFHVREAHFFPVSNTPAPGCFRKGRSKNCSTKRN